jgi:hypothetical protein
LPRSKLSATTFSESYTLLICPPGGFLAYVRTRDGYFHSSPAAWPGAYFVCRWIIASFFVYAGGKMGPTLSITSRYRLQRIRKREVDRPVKRLELGKIAERVAGLETGAPT